MLSVLPSHDVAIYAPHAGLFYDASAGMAGGGAERQTWLLARSLARRGVRVAHITFPVAEPVIDSSGPVTLIERPRPNTEENPAVRLSRESVELWKALSRSDPATLVLRGATGALGVAGAWSRLHRRRLVFAAANEGDLTGHGFLGDGDPRALLFRAGMRMADAVVVQTHDQVELARRRFPHLRQLEHIESFVEPAEDASPGEAFLWVSRLADYKRPLLFPRMAAEVPEARFWMIPTSSAAFPGEILDELRQAAAELDNFEILEQRPHRELQELMSRAVAMVNTSSFEGMPNTWLEGWARGIPALTLSFDPDNRIAERGLGRSAAGSWQEFVSAARELWALRADRGTYGATTRAYVAEVHGRGVGEHWVRLLGEVASGHGAVPADASKSG